MSVVTLIVAFAAGMLSFFSPCVFPLMPAYVSQLTGSLVRDGRVWADKWVLLLRSISFILGFSIIFILMGASASTVGQFLMERRTLIEKLGGLLIVLFGLQMAGLLNLKFLMKQISWQGKGKTGRGGPDSFLMGLAFGAGWTPCVGLALSSILMLAGSADTVFSGIVLLVMYSLGLGIPFLIITLLITYSLGYMKRINRILPILSKINGWILVGMGVLMYTSQLQKISAWLSQFTFFNML